MLINLKEKLCETKLENFCNDQCNKTVVRNHRAKKLTLQHQWGDPYHASQAATIQEDQLMADTTWVSHPTVHVSEYLHEFYSAVLLVPESSVLCLHWAFQQGSRCTLNMKSTNMNTNISTDHLMIYWLPMLQISITPFNNRKNTDTNDRTNGKPCPNTQVCALYASVSTCNSLVY